MRDQPELVRLLLRRGAVWLLWKERFSSGEPRPKYCVLMEDYDGSRTDTIVVLMTSRMDFAGRPDGIVIPVGALRGVEAASLIQLSNVRAVKWERFYDKEESLHVDMLPDSIMQQIRQALARPELAVYFSKLPADIVIRLRRVQI